MRENYNTFAVLLTDLAVGSAMRKTEPLKTWNVEVNKDET
jgi:hypothetical protein